MANFNKVFLIGNLTRDPELKYTPNGTAVTEFGIAVNRSYTSVSGEKKEDVCFVSISVFGRKAEVANEYLKKGSPIFIEGRLRFDSWETQDGQKRNRLSVVGENFQFLGRGGGGGSRRESSEPSYTDEGIDAQDVSGSEPGDDDIPF